MNIKQKQILITGGTAGIGYEIVKQLYPGNRIIVLSRNEDKLTSLKKEFHDIITYQVDLANPDEVREVAGKVVKDNDHLDILINNAAVQFTPAFLDDDFQFDTIRQEININFTSLCCLIFLLIPALQKPSESVILNVNSGLALAPKTSSAIYCATKGALNIFSQSLRYQLENTGIKVLQVFMPLVDTAMTQGRGSGKVSAKEAAQKLIHGIQKEIYEHDIAKVKLLRILLRFFPGIAKNIMKRW